MKDVSEDDNLLCFCSLGHHDTVESLPAGVADDVDADSSGNLDLRVAHVGQRCFGGIFGAKAKK